MAHGFGREPECCVVSHAVGGPMSIFDEFASVEAHHWMLRDPYRTLAYKSAISQAVAGKTVLEVGCGTGVLSIFAAQAGAKSVVALEATPMAALARSVIARNGLSHKIDVVETLSTEYRTDERFDVIIHELLAMDPFAERIVPTIRDARTRLLAPGGTLLPQRLRVCALGLGTAARPYSGTMASEAWELAAIYGIRLEPVIEALMACRSEAGGSQGAADSVGRVTDRVLTEECDLYDIDFFEPPWSECEEREHRLVVTRPGTLEEIVVFFRAHLHGDLQLTSSPFAPPTHWSSFVERLPRPLHVEAGHTLVLRSRVDYRDEPTCLELTFGACGSAENLP